MAFLIIDNNEYKMKSIDKVQYTISAGLSHDKWHKYHVHYDAAKAFESFVSCEYVVHLKSEATNAFRSQSNGNKHIIQPLSGTPENPRDLSQVW